MPLEAQTSRGFVLSRQGSIRPDLFPPGVARRSPGARREIHPLPDLADVPAGEGGEGLRLGLVTLRQLPAIAPGRLAGPAPRPGVAQDEAPLEILAVGGLLEDQILGEVGGVVAQMEPGQEDVLGP